MSETIEAINEPIVSPIIHPSAAQSYSNAILICARMLRQFEGCVLHPYKDSGGTYTIGIGSIRINGEPVTASTPPITDDQAQEMMEAELVSTAEIVDAMLHTDANDAQKAALYSFAYNEGTGALRGSTLLKLFNQGLAASAAAHFLDWVFVGNAVNRGLINRRNIEKAVFEGKVVI